MIKKTITCVTLVAILIALFTGCGNTEEPTTPTLPALKTDSDKENVSPAQTTAEGFDILGGSWVVGGFFYKPNNKQYLIDLSDDDRLMDIYDTTYLFFNEDGTFLYTNLFNSRGKYTKYGENSYILKTDMVFTYDFAEEGLVEKVKEDAPKTSYLITILDENTIHWGILDPQTGKLKLDSDPLVFEREDTESEYIQNHKTPLNSSSSNDTKSNTDSGVDTVLQGTWLFHNAETGFNETFIFNNGNFSYRTHLDDVPGSGSENSGSYEIEDGYIKLVFKNGLANEITYELNGSTLILSKYIDSGSDAGTTRIYVKDDSVANASNNGGYSHRPKDASKTNNVTSGMRNALESAKNYLSVMPFSHSGLIEQLEYEGYSHSEATYAADNCGADWYAQAVESARNYLDVMSFSRSGLIEQLEYEGYTHDQAVYGVDKVY